MADISRADAEALIQTGYANIFADSVAKNSQVMAAARTVPMGTKEYKVPVLATLPEAKWIDETEAKPTTEAIWGSKFLIAEEIAAIIPVHENVVADATEDVLAEISVRGGEAIANKFDATVLFGLQKPSGWTSPDLYAAAVAAGNVAQVSPTPGPDDLAGSFYKAAELVADDDYDPDVVFTPRGIRYRLANLRASDGQMILKDDAIAGLDARYITGATGATPVWDRTKAHAIVAEADKIVIGIRQDITVKFLDQATVGGINLAERDMVALRFVARYGYALGDNSHRVNGANVAATKTPVAAVTPAPVGG